MSIVFLVRCFANGLPVPVQFPRIHRENLCNLCPIVVIVMQPNVSYSFFHMNQ